jgi:outer membrane protein assembly factor BamD (BamD/ComL family)
LLDCENRALQVLDRIRLNDVNGPLAEEAMYWIASVQFFRKNYREADLYYSFLFQQYPNGKLAPKAIQQSIVCKQLMTGGTEYDSRPVEESKQLLHTAMQAYPELAKENDTWNTKQLRSINQFQADRDFKTAQVYERTKNPGGAYFYYDLVARNYPNTEYARKAEERKKALEAQVEKAKHAVKPGDAPKAASGAAPPPFPTTRSLTPTDLGSPKNAPTPPRNLSQDVIAGPGDASKAVGPPALPTSLQRSEAAPREPDATPPLPTPPTTPTPAPAASVPPPLPGRNP